MSKRASAKIFLVAMFLPLVAEAQSIVYSVQTDSWGVDGNHGSYRYVNTTAGSYAATQFVTVGNEYGIGIQATLNPTTPTIRWDDVVFSVPAKSFQLSDSFTTGLGQTKTVTTTINVSAATYTFASTYFHSLTAGSGGNYTDNSTNTTTGGDAFGNSVSLTGGTLTGTFSIVGPTETVTGSFSVALDWTLFQTPSIVGTLGYPGALNVRAQDGFSFVRGTFSTTNSSFVTGTVDGVLITTGISSIDLFSGDYASGASFPQLTPGTLSSIPEPSTYAAIFGLTALGFVAWRKRKGLETGAN